MSSSREVVWLHPGAIPRGPHSYGREVDDPPAGQGPEPGSIVEVMDDRDRFMGHALYNPWSDIRLRWLSRGRRTDMDRPGEFLLRQLAAADRLRKKGLRLAERTEAYRIVHAEGDDFPGLVIDRLGDAIVVEYHSLGYWRLRPELEAALAQLHPGKLVVHKVARLAVKREGFDDREPLIFASDGRVGPELEDLAVEFEECGLTHRVHPGHGHKTGWFCDQRENRLRVAELAKGRAVLDLCCNAGGFAVHAMAAGAREAVGVDMDAGILDIARANATANGVTVDFQQADIFDWLRAAVARGEQYDAVILDPAKLTRDRNKVFDALKKYFAMNRLALDVIPPGGLLLTCSCTGLVSEADFLEMLRRVALNAGREIQVLEVRGAGADHPVRTDVPESRYLKAVFCRVD